MTDTPDPSQPSEGTASSEPLPPPPPPGVVPPPPPPPAGAVPPPAWGAAAPDSPAYEPAPAVAPVAKRGIGGRVAAAVVGVAVLGGGLAYAVSQSGEGGGSSPEAAAQALFDAVGDEDVIGVLDVLPEGERRAFQGPFESIADELKRLGVVSDGLDLSDVGGIDLEFDGLEFETETLAEGVAAVRLTAGTFTSRVQPDEVPIGDGLRDVVEELSGEPIEIEAVEESDELDPNDDPVSLVAIEDGGSWRISLFYSIAEAARTDAGLPLPDFGNGVTPNGQDSPEAAVEALVRAAAEDLDVEGVIALLPPDEMAALHDYAPLFLDGLDFDPGDVGFSATINDLGLESDRDGDSATVAVRSFDVDVTIDGEDGSFAWDGECFTIDTPDGTEEQCASDQLGELDDLDLPITVDPDEIVGVTAVEVDGKWYVSPTRSMLDAVVAGLRMLDDDALARLPEIVESFFGFAEDFSDDPMINDLEDQYLDDDLLDDDDIGMTATTSTVPGERTDLDPPSRDVLVTMLIEDQGFSAEEADCIATEVYAAGFSDEVLSTLQTGEIPAEAQEQISDIVSSCGFGANEG